MFTRRTLLFASLAWPVAANAASGWSGFLCAVARDAQAQGVPARVTTAAFRGLTPDPRVIASDQAQPEFTLTWPEYRDRILPAARIETASRKWRQNHSLLATIGAIYGVDPRVVLAIWGIESNFGANRGKFRLIRSLATLAYDGRRGAYFRGELIAALQILAKGYATPSMLVGAWAGAMGQPQFMPSVYLKTAVDFDGDGKRDIWRSTPDTLASIANYLAQHGWQKDQPWLSTAPGPGSTPLQPDGGSDVFQVYANFGVIKSYNPSDFYALAVGLLANAIDT
jgi:membrane-bound lytic murein transglycosylase B